MKRYLIDGPDVAFEHLVYILYICSAQSSLINLESGE